MVHKRATMESLEPVVVVVVVIVVVVVVGDGSGGWLAINDVVPIKNRRPLTYTFLSVSGKSPFLSFSCDSKL